MFGYPLEPGFDLAKERRIDRIKWALGSGFILSAIYLFSGRPFAVEVFQGCVATIFCYGINFYVDRQEHLSKKWLWEAILATVPLHIAYLAVLFWSDKVLPGVMTKVILFMPVLMVGFGIEAILIDRVVDRFRPSRAASDFAGTPNS